MGEITARWRIAVTSGCNASHGDLQAQNPSSVSEKREKEKFPEASPLRTVLCSGGRGSRGFTLRKRKLQEAPSGQSSTPSSGRGHLLILIVGQTCLIHLYEPSDSATPKHVKRSATRKKENFYLFSESLPSFLGSSPA